MGCREVKMKREMICRVLGIFMAGILAIASTGCEANHMEKNTDTTEINSEASQENTEKYSNESETENVSVKENTEEEIEDKSAEEVTASGEAEEL